jgi:hypothetical protein
MAAWLAKEQDGTELIFKYKPKRHTFWDNTKGKWEDKHTEIDISMRIVLPKGTIEKLIGRKLMWKDEPVHLK